MVYWDDYVNVAKIIFFFFSLKPQLLNLPKMSFYGRLQVETWTLDRGTYLSIGYLNTTCRTMSSGTIPGAHKDTLQ